MPSLKRYQWRLRTLVALMVWMAAAFGIARWYRTAGPDLVISEVRIRPANPQPGELVDTLIVVRNMGWRPASNFDLHQSKSTGTSHDGVGFGLGGSTLAPGEELEYHWGAIKFADADSQDLEFTVDSNDSVAETNEANNVYSLTVQIRSKLARGASGQENLTLPAESEITSRSVTD